MEKSKKPATVTSPDVEVVEEQEDEKKSSYPNQVFNQQNNFHLSLNIDIDKLSVLSEKSPDIANRVVAIYEKQLEHNINSDNKIIKLEENEQNLRITEKPYQRKFAFTSLYFAMTLSILSLVFAVVFAYLKYPYLAVVSITIPISVAVANMLGFKASRHKKSNQEKNDSEDEEES